MKQPGFVAAMCDIDIVSGPLTHCAVGPCQLVIIGHICCPGGMLEKQFEE